MFKTQLLYVNIVNDPPALISDLAEKCIHHTFTHILYTAFCELHYICISLFQNYLNGIFYVILFISNKLID